MKIRKGFVSNSSSSSYVCDVCGEDYSGYDASLADADMYCCENGHTYCEEHAKKNIDDLDVDEKRAVALTYCWDEEDKAKVLEGSEEYIDEALNDGEIRYEMPAICCPCCQLTAVTDEQLIEYMLHERHQTKADVVKEIAQKYQNYDEMLKDIK